MHEWVEGRGEEGRRGGEKRRGRAGGENGDGALECSYDDTSELRSSQSVTTSHNSLIKHFQVPLDIHYVQGKGRGGTYVRP